MQLLTLMIYPILVIVFLALLIYGVLYALGFKTRPLKTVLLGLFALLFFSLCIVAMSFVVLSNTSFG